MRGGAVEHAHAGATGKERLGRRPSHNACTENRDRLVVEIWQEARGDVDAGGGDRGDLTEARGTADAAGGLDGALKNAAQRPRDVLACLSRAQRVAYLATNLF